VIRGRKDSAARRRGKGLALVASPEPKSDNLTADELQTRALNFWCATRPIPNQATLDALGELGNADAAAP
jgi:hypothetical protein